MRILLLLLFPFVVSAQSVLSGWVVDAKTKQPVAFATVGLIRANSGVTASETGAFKIDSEQPLQHDTLVVSCVGYQTKKIALKDLPGGSIRIELDAFVQELTPVVVGKRDWNYVRLNEYSSPASLNSGTRGYAQLAQYFSAPEAGGILHSVQLCRLDAAIFGLDKTVFRLRVYDIDSLTGGPGADLCQKVIEVNTGKRTVRVALDSLQIMIPKKEFFVAIEWLKLPMNEMKEKVKMTDGKRLAYKGYRPSLYFSNVQTPQVNYWMKLYNGKWQRMSKTLGKTNLAMMAIVKL